MSEAFERWLRSVCFQKPTPEAYDLAKCAWDHMDAKLQAAEAEVKELQSELKNWTENGFQYDWEQECIRLQAEVARLKENHPLELILKLNESNARIAELEAEHYRMRQERMDYSSVTTTEGLNCSEWIWRTGAAERKAKAAARTATEAALRWAWNEYINSNFVIDPNGFIERGLLDLLVEK